MGIGAGQTGHRADRSVQAWQRLFRTATNQALGHYLHGCAGVAMARTPQQALAALHRTQTTLLRHSANTFVAIAKLWGEQSIDRFAAVTKHARTPRKSSTRSGP
jgi:hypothetical protein